MDCQDVLATGNSGFLDGSGVCILGQFQNSRRKSRVFTTFYYLILFFLQSIEDRLKAINTEAAETQRYFPYHSVS